jgi:protein translocase SecG subunit
MGIIARILPYTQITLSVILIVLVLLQQSDADLGGAFGGSDSFSNHAHTRRGIEKTLFNSTILIGILFVISSIIALIAK